MANMDNMLSELVERVRVLEERNKFLEEKAVEGNASRGEESDPVIMPAAALYQFME